VFELKLAHAPLKMIYKGRTVRHGSIKRKAAHIYLPARVVKRPFPFALVLADVSELPFVHRAVYEPPLDVAGIIREGPFHPVVVHPRARARGREDVAGVLVAGFPVARVDLDFFTAVVVPRVDAETVVDVVDKLASVHAG